MGVVVQGLLGAGVLGYRLGTFADGMLGEFTRKQESDSRLDLSRRNCRPLVVMSKARGFGGDTLKDVINQTVHDTHRLAGDTGVRVDLLQHLVNIDAVRLLPPLLTTLLIALSEVLHCLVTLLHSFAASLLRCHRRL